LAALRPDDFDLHSATPTATVRAAYTKNGQTAVQPLAKDLADVFRPFLANRPSEQSVWPGKWSGDAAEMIRHDLAEARAAWLSAAQNARQRAEREKSDFLTYRDAGDRVADFHALRHTFISRIVQSGASAKTAQTLARHSTVQLTLGRYAHATLLDLASAVDSLPPISPAEPTAAWQALQATGTDGRAVTETGSRNLGPNLVPQTAISGDSLRQTETDARISAAPENVEKTREILQFPLLATAGLEPARPYGTGDFKSPASAIPPRGRRTLNLRRLSSAAGGPVTPQSARRRCDP